VAEADACFIGGATTEDRRAASRRAKTMAQGLGKSIRTYAMCTVVHAETDAAADALARRYADGVDLDAVRTMLRSWGAPADKLDEAARKQGAFMTETVIGSPATCGEKIEAFVTDCELDGLMMIFPDYVAGLTMFGEGILPGLRRRFA
jgi:pyrimidine oxygenase